MHLRDETVLRDEVDLAVVAARGAQEGLVSVVDGLAFELVVVPQEDVRKEEQVNASHIGKLSASQVKIQTSQVNPMSLVTWAENVLDVGDDLLLVVLAVLHGEGRLRGELEIDVLNGVGRGVVPRHMNDGSKIGQSGKIRSDQVRSD